MPFAFFALAARSRSRQSVFRRVVVAHLLVLAAGWVALAVRGPGKSAELLGHLLLVAGIVEGAVLIGWRLTQMPKSQALEFMLVTPLRPRRSLRCGGAGRSGPARIRDAQRPADACAAGGGWAPSAARSAAALVCAVGVGSGDGAGFDHVGV